MQQLVVGNIVEGKVTGITKFGAFVDLGDGKTGMVHISEVAPTFVKEIRDFVKENDTVKVKVLSISEDGKISLSMKKAEPQQAAPAKTERPARPKRTAPPRDMGWRGPKPTPEPQSFEDMMNRFKQTSDDKMSDHIKAACFHIVSPTATLCPYFWGYDRGGKIISRSG